MNITGPRISRPIVAFFTGAALISLIALGTSSVVAKDASVKVIDFKFDPEAVTVTVGSVVTWTNAASRDHTVTANDGSFDSGDIAKGETFGNLFDTPGTFAYHCTIHPDRMKGTIVVTAAAPISSKAGTPEPTPPAGTLPPGFGSPSAAPPPSTPGGAPASRSPSPAILLVAAVGTAIVIGFIVANRRRKPPAR